MSKIYTCLSVKIIPCSDIFLGVAQALAIFKTKSFADAALEEMEEKCLVMTGHMR